MKITKWSYELERLKGARSSLFLTLALAQQSVARWETSGDLLLVMEFRPQIEQLSQYVNELSDLIASTEVLHQAAILTGNYE